MKEPTTIRMKTTKIIISRVSDLLKIYYLLIRRIEGQQRMLFYKRILNKQYVDLIYCRNVAFNRESFRMIIILITVTIHYCTRYLLFSSGRLYIYTYSIIRKYYIVVTTIILCKSLTSNEMRKRWQIIHIFVSS